MTTAVLGKVLIVSAAVIPSFVSIMSFDVTPGSIAAFLALGALGFIQWLLLREVAKVDAIDKRLDDLRLAHVRSEERIAALASRLDTLSRSMP